MSGKTYKYYGAVKQFDHIVDRNWRGETYALTEKHARRNLIAQYKRDHGYAMNAKIDLVDKIKAVEDGENDV